MPCLVNTHMGQSWVFVSVLTFFLVMNNRISLKRIYISIFDYSSPAVNFELHRYYSKGTSMLGYLLSCNPFEPFLWGLPCFSGFHLDDLDVGVLAKRVIHDPLGAFF